MASFSPSAERPVIIGAGLAGLTVALSLAPIPVVVLSAGKLGEESSSAWAQGGVAAAMGEGDTPALHAADTIRAGAGLCNADIARLVTGDGPAIIERLAAAGTIFDAQNGKLKLGLEAAHGKRRIVHARGDGTGRAIMNAMIASVRAAPSIDVIENARATDLLVDDNGIRGVAFVNDGKPETMAADRIVLATGGAGALWQHTTNPLGSWGQGLALAARAGAELCDLEFMQFHPTAIDIDPKVRRGPMPLASEALRGEGAVLVDEEGRRFCDELAPRDIVTRAIWAHRMKGHKIFLDARASIGGSFAERFPFIYAVCVAAGIDPAREPIPVRPAAHYHMGGIAVDAKGRSSVDGLWACGEVASTGLHGANRLASNSLLEAASFGRRVAEDIAAISLRCMPAVLKPMAHVRKEPIGGEKVRDIMTAHVGVLRHEEGLKKAAQELSMLAPSSDMALVGLMIATAALRREESRGSHARTDYPETSSDWAHRKTITLADVGHTAPAKDPLYVSAIGA